MEHGEENATKKAKKIWKIVGVSLAGVGVAVGCFFGGYFTYASKVDGGIRTLLWLKDTIQREYNYEVSDDAFYAAALKGVNDMLDPYSGYMTESDYKENLDSAAGNWTGIGLQFSTADKDGNARVLVSRVTGNSPAYFAGIKAGDFVIGYGETSESVTAVTSYAQLSSFFSERELGETFCLKLKRSADGSEYFAEARKARFVENYVSYRSNTSAFVFTGSEATTLTETEDRLPALGEDTAYIRLTQFNGAAVNQFGQAMSVFKRENKKNLVLDLRGNGGGYMSILERIASYFCKDGTGGNPTIAVANYGNGARTEFRASANAYYEYFSSQSRICVLADNSTASASECLIGCMVDYGAVKMQNIYLYERVAKKTENGQTVYFAEAKTYGKGIMQTTFTRNPLSENTEAVKLTTADVSWPVSGRCIHGVGVTEEDGAKRLEEQYFSDAEIQAALADFLAND